MANQATTTYKVTGSRKAVKDLWSTLQKMEVNSKNVWLYQLAEHYGIDYEAKHISVRGHIYWAEFEEDPANDYYLLSFVFLRQLVSIPDRLPLPNNRGYL